VLRKIKLIRILFLYIITLYLFLGCKTTKPIAKVDIIPVIASLDLVDVVNDKVKVSLKITDLKSDTISYYLPKIVPGTYQTLLTRSNLTKYFLQQALILYVIKISS